MELEKSLPVENMLRSIFHVELNKNFGGDRKKYQEWLQTSPTSLTPFFMGLLYSLENQYSRGSAFHKVVRRENELRKNWIENNEVRLSREEILGVVLYQIRESQVAVPQTWARTNGLDSKYIFALMDPNVEQLLERIAKSLAFSILFGRGRSFSSEAPKNPYGIEPWLVIRLSDSQIREDFVDMMELMEKRMQSARVTGTPAEKRAAQPVFSGQW